MVCFSSQYAFPHSMLFLIVCFSCMLILQQSRNTKALLGFNTTCMVNSDQFSLTVLTSIYFQKPPAFHPLGSRQPYRSCMPSRRLRLLNTPLIIIDKVYQPVEKTRKEGSQVRYWTAKINMLSSCSVFTKHCIASAYIRLPTSACIVTKATPEKLRVGVLFC